MLDVIVMLKEERNLFIHGLWGEPTEDEKNIFVIIKGTKIERDPKMGLVVRKHQHTLNSINIISAELEQRIQQSKKILNDLNAEIIIKYSVSV
jgi:hypothetical protein